MPIDDARRSPVSLPEWILRCCVAIRAFGLGDAYLWNPMERDSPIFALLYFDWHWTEAWAMGWEDAGMACSVIAGLIVISLPFLARRPFGVTTKNASAINWRRWENVVLAFVVCWELAYAVAKTVRGGSFLSELAVPSHGLRMGVPLALMACNRSRCMPDVAIMILRLATAATFAAHGLKAWYVSPRFTSMILGTWPSLSQGSAETMLHWIGGFDLVLAVLVLSTRWHTVAIYMALWGAVTAVGHTLGTRFSQYPEMLLRVAHAGGPLVLFLQWRCGARLLKVGATNEHE